MFTKEQLSHGIEWISGKTKITATYTEGFIGGNLEVILFPDYPNTQSIFLYLELDSEDNVTVTDLIGNGYFSNYQSCGYGTLIFSIGVQVIYSYFGMASGDKAAKEIILTGKVSNREDPDEEQEKVKCGTRRNRFWSGNGFRLREPNKYNTIMKACLADMIIQKKGVTANGTPRNIGLEEFWLIGEAPELIEPVIQDSPPTGVGKNEADNCPTQAEVDQADKVFRQLSSGIERVLRLVVGILFVYMLVLNVKTWEIIPLSLSGLFVIYLILKCVKIRFGHLLPTYQQSLKLQQRRREFIYGTKDAVVKREAR